MSTHQATDLADGVDAVVVLVDGKIRFDASVDAFRRLVGSPESIDAMARAYSHVMTGVDW